MGLFKKKKTNKEEHKSEINNTETQNKIENIEVLDFDEKKEKIENTIEQRKENRLLIIIIVLIIIFVLLLPKITSLFSKKSIFTYTDKVDDIVNNKTVDGMLEINQNVGTITAKNIRFYNPLKRTNNEISIVFLPENSIKNVNDLNIYIELYNDSKTIIYRTKFIQKDKLERKVQGTYSLNVNENIYKEAKYLKITIIKEEDFKKSNEALICTNKFTENSYEIVYKNTYNFSQKGLINYQIDKKIIEKNIENDGTELPNEEELENKNKETLNKYINEFKKEKEQIEKTDVKDLTSDETSINYTIDLLKTNLGKSDYKFLYNLGSVKKQIKFDEEKNGWVCE